jgi:hypothetical protein
MKLNGVRGSSSKTRDNHRHKRACPSLRPERREDGNHHLNLKLEVKDRKLS